MMMMIIIFDDGFDTDEFTFAHRLKHLVHMMHIFFFIFLFLFNVRK